jgi:hypothetical protein
MARRTRIAPVRRTRADQIAEKQLEQLDYRELQKRAGELDIPANQSADVLRAAIQKAGAE